jgi:hypothetical protein
MENWKLASVLVVKDISLSLDDYRGRLGFSVQPQRQYAKLCRVSEAPRRSREFLAN